MVRETKKEDGLYYICEECEFAYKERGWAQKCEDWCKERNSCSMEITRHSVKI